MDGPISDRLRDALFDDGNEPGPDLWPALRARLDPAPSRPLGRRIRWGIPAGLALAAAILAMLFFGAFAGGDGSDEPRAQIRVIDVPTADRPTGDAAHEEAARLLDERPAYLEDGSHESEEPMEDR